LPQIPSRDHEASTVFGKAKSRGALAFIGREYRLQRAGVWVIPQDGMPDVQFASINEEPGVSGGVQESEVLASMSIGAAKEFYFNSAGRATSVAHPP
jgi:hypothetical protein